MGMAARRLRHSFTLLAALVLSGVANAVHSSVPASPPDEGDEPMDELVAPQHPLAMGQVVAVDRTAGTITLRHKPIPGAFMMETMTMIFRVADRTMLEGLTAGDKVRFEVQRDGRSYVVVRIENSN